MLYGLGHNTFVRGDDQHGKVNAPSPGQHIFDEFFVARHIHDPCLRAVRPVQSGKPRLDGNAPALFLRQAVRIGAGERLDQNGFAVIYMARRADDDVFHEAVSRKA